LRKRWRAEDDERLALAIEEAEAHHLVVHAARMRIVLAQRHQRQTHLEKAGQCWSAWETVAFLCRLQEVEAALASPRRRIEG